MFNTLSNKDFKTGVKDSSPICIAFVFMCMSFGGFAKINGFTIAQTMSIGMLVYSIPLQVIILQLFKTGMSLATVALLSLIVNSRFFLMSLSLMPYFKKESIKKLIPSLFILSASSFTVAHVKFTSKSVDSPFKYYLGIALAAYITTFISTISGFYIMSASTNSIMMHVFAIALGIHFTALTAMRWPKIRLVISTLLGFLLMPLLSSIIQTDISIVLVPICVAAVIFLATKVGEKK